MAIKAKELTRGFRYTIKGESNLFIYLGKTRYLGSSESLAFQAKEDYLFVTETEENSVYKHFPLKNIVSSNGYAMDEEKALALYTSYTRERDQCFRQQSSAVTTELSKLLLHPCMVDYLKTHHFENAFDVLAHAHEQLHDAIKQNDALTYYNTYEKEPHHFKENVLEAYLLMLYNIKYHVTKHINTDTLSKKKLENYLFTNEALTEIMRCIQEEKDVPVALKIFKHGVNQADGTQEQFALIFEEKKHHVIDFSKRHDERTTNLIQAKEESTNKYHLYHLNTLFGDVIYLYGDFNYINKLEFLHHPILNETIYKKKALKK